MTAISSEWCNDQLLVELPADLGGPLPAALRELILAETRTGITVRLDAGAVEKVSTPGVQVLLAAADLIGRREARLVLAKPSEALVEAFSDLGLFANLMAWNVE